MIYSLLINGRSRHVTNTKLTHNVTANIIQAVASALLLFALYRNINTILGVEKLGIWSVVLASASAANLANFGLSSSVVRFVARDRAQANDRRAGHVVDTAMLTLAALVAIALPFLYAGIANLLPHLFKAEDLSQALEILPYALISFWLNIIANVFVGALDGCQRMDLRAALVISGQIVLLLLAIWLLPTHGLLGLAWAQICQGVFLVFTGRILLTRALPAFPLFAVTWRKGVLKEMFGYGANIQVATLFILLLDPVAKALMARFGGAVTAGYFEMANQIVIKLRGLIVMANQAVVPHAATLSESSPAQLENLYRQNLRVLIFVGSPALALLVAWSGVASWAMTGEYRPEFTFMLNALTLAWGINIFSGPAYFINLGSGRVGWNTIAHIAMGTMNAALGWTLGTIYGGGGVILAYSSALIAGSMILITTFQRRLALKCAVKDHREHVLLLTACAAIVSLSYWEPLKPSVTLLRGRELLQLLAPTCILMIAIWMHPFRQEIYARINAKSAKD